MVARNLAIVSIIVFFQSGQVFGGLYDYICKEEQLFRPYLRIYEGRRGKLLSTLGPGFHVIDPSLKNIWVCINGPAFLYYAKNTTLGLVYEAPQPLVYSHTCEMQNVIPKTPQAKMPTLILTLLTVLLYGDEKDYRLPFIQPFTAPYFFKADEYAPDFPAHFQNATSIAIIGRMDCTLIRGASPGIPLVFRPVPKAIPTACATVGTAGDDPLPTCDPAATGGPPPPGDPVPPLITATTEVAGSICRLGFSKDILTPTAASSPPDPVLLKQMQGLVNSEPIVKGSCRTDNLDKADFDAKRTSIDTLRTAADAEVAKMATWQADYDKKVDDTIASLTAEVAAIDLKITPVAPDPPPTPKVLAKLQTKKAALEEAVTLETAKKTDFTTLYTNLNTAKTITPPPAGEADTAVTSWTTLKTKTEELEKMEKSDPTPPAPGDIDTKKDEIYTAKIEALTNSGIAWKGLSTYEMEVSQLSLLVGQVQKRFNGYTPTKPNLKKRAKPKASKKKIEYKERSEGVLYEINSGTPPLGECVSLPVLGGPEGQCKKGKPDPVGSCGLFKASLGLDTSDWQTDAEWKEDILKDVASIFSTACPYFPNRSKFLTRLNRLMIFYLKSKEHFNLDKPAEGTSSACLIIKDWMNGSGVPPLVTPPPPVVPVVPGPGPGPPPPPGGGPAPPPPPPEPNLIRRPFWDQIDEVLKNCKEAKNNTLVFMDRSELYGKWKWVKLHPNGDTSEHDIIPMKEQAEVEFVFNWVIDMTWRIFGTVLGICVVDHEDRIPHVASKFQSLFTEDFLIPLAESWINAKDNVIFQWIIGEFYNGDAEDWATRCMEASFQRSDRLIGFRPPRPLLVNCESEYNYFIEGDLASEGGVLPFGREKYTIVTD